MKRVFFVWAALRMAVAQSHSQPQAASYSCISRVWSLAGSYSHGLHSWSGVRASTSHSTGPVTGAAWSRHTSSHHQHFKEGM